MFFLCLILFCHRFCLTQRQWFEEFVGTFRKNRCRKWWKSSVPSVFMFDHWWSRFQCTKFHRWSSGQRFCCRRRWWTRWTRSMIRRRIDKCCITIGKTFQSEQRFSHTISQWNRWNWSNLIDWSMKTIWHVWHLLDVRYYTNQQVDFANYLPLTTDSYNHVDQDNSFD